MGYAVTDWISAIAAAIAAVLAVIAAWQARNAARDSKESSTQAASAAEQLAVATEGIRQMHVLQAHSCLAIEDCHAQSSGRHAVDVRFRIVNLGGMAATLWGASVWFGRQAKLAGLYAIGTLDARKELPIREGPPANKEGDYLPPLRIEAGQTLNLFIRCKREVELESPILVELEPRNGPPLRLELVESDEGWDVETEETDDLARLDEWWRGKTKG